AAAWHRLLAGDHLLVVEGIKGVHGTRHRQIQPAELPRLTLDWRLSRLMGGAGDGFIAVTLRAAPAEAAKKAPPALDALQAAMRAVAGGFPDGTPRPTEAQVATLMRALIPGITRADVRFALTNYAPHLKRPRGDRPPKSPV